MIVSNKLMMQIMEMGRHAEAGRVEDARLINGQLWSTLSPLCGPQSQPELMELLGSVAITLKDAQQLDIALPWFEQLCHLASRFAPESDDTAWDYCHLAKCLEATGRNREAMEWLRKAEAIVSCGSDDDQLPQTIQQGIASIAAKI